MVGGCENFVRLFHFMRIAVVFEAAGHVLVLSLRRLRSFQLFERVVTGRRNHRSVGLYSRLLILDELLVNVRVLVGDVDFVRVLGYGLLYFEL